MITRIVKLNIKANCIDDFILFFEENKKRIESMSGCKKVNMFRQLDGGQTFFTISTWISEEDLQQYKKSLFFKTMWPQAKTMFDQPALAWSTEKLD